ncbi:ABC transporter permease [Actibacterium pelagium]|uniref:Nopaline transport system permease protein NocQ n=1 Tax=Actibacterium pelagium TaxID=2029103 RepID=A0A917EP27_9RHOB|nr:ABC transporter permease subunit [Actibacterium pelagium]GGE61715.1 nopaline transport system permease protein NocQ [Actibacterium pelagium]
MFELLSFGDSGWGDDLIIGALLTIRLALASLSLGLLFGLVLAMMKLSRLAPARWLAEAYTLFIRGVPEFLILLMVFFGTEKAVATVGQWLGFETTFEVPKFAAAVAGLSAIFAAYCCEVIRGAYLAVPKGQIEAGLAVGMSRWQIFQRIRVPQLWRFALPGLGNLWLVMLKDTSLAAVLAIDELLRVAKVAGEATRNPLLFLLAAGLLYLIMTAVSDHLRARMEKRLNRGMAR